MKLTGRTVLLTTILTTTFMVESAPAISLVVIGKNGTQLASADVRAENNVGLTTVKGFEQFHIPYVGSEYGLNSIYGLGSDLEIISDSKMKAWGWCFSLDNSIAETMPNQTQIGSDSKEIKWFYGYALYDRTAWTGYCLQ
jgi:hypothetical protein